MQPKYIVVILGALVLAAGAYIITQNPAALIDEAPTATTTPSNSTSTPGTPTTKPKEDLSKYPVHNIPEGARVIDDYFYVLNGSVYLNSVAGTSSIMIPDARGNSFERLTEFRSVPDPAIAIDCVKAGNYAYYADSQSVFMYQIWLNTQFRRSKLERVIGVAPTEFQVLSASSFKGGDTNYALGYEVATSTCDYTITEEE